MMTIIDNELKNTHIANDTATITELQSVENRIDEKIDDLKYSVGNDIHAVWNDMYDRLDDVRDKLNLKIEILFTCNVILFGVIFYLMWR